MPEIKRRKDTPENFEFFCGSWIGVDPGESGGIACIHKQQENYGKITTEIRLYPMPDTELDRLNVLGGDEHGNNCDPNVQGIIEHVHSFPGQGVASSFKFGANYGGLRMALAASEIPFEVVQPRVWQKGLGIKPRAKDESKPNFKKRLRAHCQRLYPKVQGITLKTADALLMATYLQRKHEGRL